MIMHILPLVVIVHAQLHHISPQIDSTIPFFVILVVLQKSFHVGIGGATWYNMGKDLQKVRSSFESFKATSNNINGSWLNLSLGNFPLRCGRRLYSQQFLN